MKRFIRNNMLVTAVKRQPYQFQDGSFSGWAIVFLPLDDKYGHQDGDRMEFGSLESMEAEFARLPDAA